MNDETTPRPDDETRVVPPVAASTAPDPTDRLQQTDQPAPYAQGEPSLLGEQAYAEPQRRTGSHPVNVGQLAMGLVFLTAVVVWALIQSDTVTGHDIRWLVPLPWVIGGAIGLVASAISGVRRHGLGR